MSGGEAFALSALMSSVGTMSSINAQRAALNRENYRTQTEAKLAKVQALEEENARQELARMSLANNSAYQSIAGYYDDGMSFLNMNKQVESKTLKDISNIRVMASSTQNKYRQMLYENKMKDNELVFGGYTSVMAELATGYANYKWYG
tara:strand:- start:2439 stop:2882 length:444 start_codon:yes stop_codon:yes gene_type:complete